MTTQLIRRQDRDGIRSIVIDRAGKANALTADMMHALAEAIGSARPRTPNWW